ncbi:MAG TPA: alpha/beta hydrolase [Anaerolineae bacterium]|nr:alpha/beta hydrolase [Anaerolineae bacterium]
MSRYHIDSVELHTLDVGAGQPVLLLHGLGSCGDDWLFQTPVFSRQYRVIAPDFRGHGSSTDSAEPITIPRLAKDMVGLMSALDISSAHVVGLSLGGLVAQQLALDYPDKVDRMVLTNTFAHLWPTSMRETLILGRRAIVSLWLPMHATARVVAADLFPKPDQAELRKAIIDRVGGNNERSYRKFIQAVRRFDVRRQLPNIQAPTLVIAGERDTLVPRSCQQQLVRSIPNAEWKLIQDSGHATPIDQVEKFNQVVLEFLKKDEARRLKDETQPSDSSFSPQSAAL